MNLSKTLLGSVVLMVVPSLSFAEMPRYDVKGYCQVIASVGGTYSETMNAGCFEMEQSSYNNMKPKWDNLSSNLQKYCDQIARVGGGGSYSMLEGCIQMEEQAGSTDKTFKY